MIQNTNKIGIAAAAALLVLAVGQVKAERFEHPKLGWSVEIPLGWKHKLDGEGSALLLGAPGGLRFRIEVASARSDLTKADVMETYKSDGKLLVTRYGKVKVLARPAKVQAVGGAEAYGFTFAYKDLDDSVVEVRNWMASGTARDSGRRLHAHLRAYGPHKLLPKYESDLNKVLRSFGWPTPAAEGAAPAEPARVKNPVVAMVDMPSAVMGDLPTQIPGEALAIAKNVMTQLGGGDGYSGKVPEGHDANARAYDRGSLQGGLGFMKEAQVLDDPEVSRKLRATFRIKDRGVRSDEEKAKAAAYLGFALPSATQ